jgi:hypothetical protein
MSEMNEWPKWIDEAISKKHIKHYEYNHFKNIQEIGISGFGKVYRVKWNLSLILMKVPLGNFVHEVINKIRIINQFLCYFRLKFYC